MITEQLIQLDDLKNFLNIVDHYIITSITDTKGTITDVSQAFCDISGYAKEELIGEAHNLIRHEDTPPSLFKEMWKTIKSGNMWQGELKNRKKNGDFYWVVSTIFPRFDAKNNIIGYISLRQDITDSKLLIERERLLKVQSKNAAMGEMISMIAHQWKQPLATISAISSNILLKKDLNKLTMDELEEDVHKIEAYTNHLSDTATAFKNFFNPKETKEAVLLSELLNYTIQLIGPALIESGISLYFQCQDKELIKHDRSKPLECAINESVLKLFIPKNDLIQVLLNLIKNSIDASLEQKIKDPEIYIRVNKVDQEVLLKVEDNCGGIQDYILEGIFSPYRTSKGDKGTGLGLYMCKVIIEDHLQGKIQAHNTSKGAAFTIILPQL